jgi:hypothetical protein
MRRSAPDGTPAPSPPPPQPSGPTGPGRITDDDYLTVVEVAAMWHCSTKTVYRRVYGEELPYINVAGAGARQASIRIRRSAAHQYMADRERSVRAA